MHRLYANSVLFYVREEHLWNLVSTEGPGPPPLWTLRDDCSKQKYHSDFLPGSLSG